MSNISTIKIPRELSHTHAFREKILQACFQTPTSINDIAAQMGIFVIRAHGNREEVRNYNLFKRSISALIGVGLMVSIKPKTGYQYLYKALYRGYGFELYKHEKKPVALPEPANKYGMQVGSARVFKIDHRPRHLEVRPLSKMGKIYVSGATLAGIE